MSEDLCEGRAPFDGQCSGQVAGVGMCLLLLGLCLFGPGQPRTAAMDGTEGETIGGLVQQPDGSPAREGNVYLIRRGEALRLVNGEVPELWTTSGAQARSGVADEDHSRGSILVPARGGRVPACGGRRLRVRFGSSRLIPREPAASPPGMGQGYGKRKGRRSACGRHHDLGGPGIRSGSIGG